MVHTLETDEFLGLLAAQPAGGCLIDVRTPAEYADGHIVGAVNLPLFSDEQRRVVGTLYVQVGRDQAVEKGLEFVGPRMVDIVREARRMAPSGPLFIYCWRGGMRSGSMAWLLSTAGRDVYLLKGGYKAYRSSFERMLDEIPWQIEVLSGSTGCGKTELLMHLSAMGQQVIDLEGLANHKGSVFGAIGQQTQPTTEHFINKLHQVFRTMDPARTIWCEGESMSIGHVHLPQKLYAMIRRAPQTEVVMDVEQRLDRLMVEYGTFPLEAMSEAFTKIRKHMGADQVNEAIEALGRGAVRHAARLALVYYDKVYKKHETGNARTLIADNNDMKHSAVRLLDAVK